MNNPENLDKEKARLKETGDDKENTNITLSGDPNKDELAKSESADASNSDTLPGRKSYFTKMTVEEINNNLKKVDPGMFRIAGSSSSVAGKIKDNILTLDILSSVSINNQYQTRTRSFELVSDSEGTKLIACKTPSNLMANTIKRLVMIIVAICFYKYWLAGEEFQFDKILSSFTFFDGCLILFFLLVAQFLRPIVLKGVVEKDFQKMDEFIVKTFNAETIDPDTK